MGASLGPAVVPREVVGSQPDTGEEEQPPSKGTSCLLSGVMVSITVFLRCPCDIGTVLTVPECEV
ncbi:hypothetical protein Celaphus_00016247 [Cervus elaphus hippelaphus]|uniref:Uncharacterized protein n=1 Tax=Cervus elaphus hippelaphus TaxID=46360 RepID=A0A212CEA3_CEREH|nr:hypothetical protein Celaphus_00016247 [Cervus elaphus hippelaphus]